MRNLHLHPDGHLMIRVDSGVYASTLEQFAEDFGEPFPTLPPGASECFYDQGMRHMLVDHNNRLMIEHPMPMPWPEGDHILERAAHLLQKQHARLKAQEEGVRARLAATAPRKVTQS